MNAVAARRLALSVAADLLADPAILAGVDLADRDRPRVLAALADLAESLRRRTQPKKRAPNPAPQESPAPVGGPWRASVACVDPAVWMADRGRPRGWWRAAAAPWPEAVSTYDSCATRNPTHGSWIRTLYPVRARRRGVAEIGGTTMSDPYGQYPPAPPVNRPPAPYADHDRQPALQPHAYQPHDGYQGSPCAVCGTTHQPAVPQQYAPAPYQQQPGFAPQPGAHRAGDLRSERIVVEAPLSFTGSQKRIWRAITWNSYRQTPLFWLALAPLAIILILLAWSFVLCWYLIFGLWLVPYRMIRRSSRKQKVDAARHAEMMSRLPGQPPQNGSWR